MGSIPAGCELLSLSRHIRVPYKEWAVGKSCTILPPPATKPVVWGLEMCSEREKKAITFYTVSSRVQAPAGVKQAIHVTKLQHRSVGSVRRVLDCSTRAGHADRNGR